MVAVAKLMNATLVMPSLDHDSFWNDTRCVIGQQLFVWLNMMIQKYVTSKFFCDFAVSSKTFLTGDTSLMF